MGEAATPNDSRTLEAARALLHALIEHDAYEFLSHLPALKVAWIWLPADHKGEFPASSPRSTAGRAARELNLLVAFGVENRRPVGTRKSHCTSRASGMRGRVKWTSCG
jgi:hypothetical protein